MKIRCYGSILEEMTSHWHVPGRCACLADHVKWTDFDVAVTFKRWKLQESPKWGNTRPTFYALRVLHLFPPWTGTNSSYHSTSQRFLFKKIIYIYVLPGPPSSRLRLLLWCSSVLGRTGQWGRGAEKAGPRWVYCIKCSAHCSDWLMPTEASGLNTRAAEGGLVRTRGLIWRLRF